METNTDTANQNKVYYCQKCKRIPKLIFKPQPEDKVEVEITCEKCKEAPKLVGIKDLSKEILSFAPYEVKNHPCEEEGCTKEGTRFCLTEHIYLCEDCSKSKHKDHEVKEPFSSGIGSYQLGQVREAKNKVNESLTRLHEEIKKEEEVIQEYESHFQVLKDNLAKLKEYTAKIEEIANPILVFMEGVEQAYDKTMEKDFDYYAQANMHELSQSNGYYRGDFLEKVIDFVNDIKSKNMTKQEKVEFEKQSALTGKAYPYLCKSCHRRLENPLGYREGKYGDYVTYDGDDHWYPQSCNKCSNTAILHYYG